MLAQTLLISLSFASVALSVNQYGAGRFYCNVFIGGVAFPDPLLCLNPPPTGTDTGVPSTSYKSDGYTPVASQCLLDPNGSGNYFCGFRGAACDPLILDPVLNNCDNGFCGLELGGLTGVCQGNFGAECTFDEFCLGLIYCTDSAGEPASGTCGGIGSYCQDPYLSGNPDPQLQADAFDATCASTYCDPNTAVCAARVPIGGDCTADTLSCVAGAVCVAGICAAVVPPSGIARARRNIERRSNLCPESQTACSITGSTGFECIDTMTNLEQCGACSMNGGTDCTMLSGVDAVGCVDGVCEVWACAAGFAYDAISNSCLIALVA